MFELVDPETGDVLAKLAAVAGLETLCKFRDNPPQTPSSSPTLEVRVTDPVAQDYFLLWHNKLGETRNVVIRGAGHELAIRGCFLADAAPVSGVYCLSGNVLPRIIRQGVPCLLKRPPSVA